MLLGALLGAGIVYLGGRLPSATAASAEQFQPQILKKVLAAKP
jgi:hypothetical protein